jgi:hypothetical protein
MMPIQAAVDLAAPWATLYSNHPLIQSGVVFAHISGLMVGGGAAVAADRAALRARHATAGGRRRYLRQLRWVHRTVLGGLVVVCLSGVLLFASDVKTYATSPVFWVKSGLVALLLINGAFLLRVERGINRRGIEWETGWKRLKATAILSLSLWLLIVLAGSILVNIG